MRNLLLTIVLLVNSISSAQSQQSFDRLIEQTKRYLSIHAKTPVYEEYYVLKSLDMTNSELKQLMNGGAAVGAHFTSDRDSILSSDLLMYLNEVIPENLDKLLAHEKFSYEGIKELIQEDYDFYVVVSPDRKLFNFSLDDKHGGTYRSRTSRTIYLHTEIDSITQKPIRKKFYPILSSDGLGRIYSLETKEGIKYVTTAFVRGCSYCFESTVSLVKFEEGLFKTDFSYTVNSRHWEGGVEYDHKNQTISVNYRTDDLTEFCNCENGEENDNQATYTGYTQEREETKPKQCHCKFKFDGNNFELIKAGWEKLELEE